MTKDEKTSGRAKGGKARAEVLSPETRKKIAKNAALARWGVKAIKKGNFKEDFGINVDCYVLDDEDKTAVISKFGMGESLGLGQGGSRLTRFVKYKNIAPYIGPDLAAKIDKPLVFQGIQTGQVHGYDVTILIDICKAILQAEAEGALTKNQQVVAQQARIIINASAKIGIKGLVYALSGYDVTREEFIAAFKTYIQQEAREYEKEFPDELYQEWYRIYKLQKPKQGRPWNFKHLTLKQVYTPLANSNGKILELTKATKADSKQRNAKLHQFLSEIGVKALRQQLGALIGIARISDTKEDYERNVAKAFGGQQKLTILSSPTVSEPLS